MRVLFSPGTPGRGPTACQEPVDLLALVAEEGARHEVDIRGEALVTAGDPRLLRRLVRNLLENARRHGGEAQCRPREGGGTVFEVLLAGGAG